MTKVRRLFHRIPTLQKRLQHLSANSEIKRIKNRICCDWRMRSLQERKLKCNKNSKKHVCLKVSACATVKWIQILQINKIPDSKTKCVLQSIFPVYMNSKRVILQTQSYPNPSMDHNFQPLSNQASCHSSALCSNTGSSACTSKTRATCDSHLQMPIQTGIKVWMSTYFC